MHEPLIAAKAAALATVDEAAAQDQDGDLNGSNGWEGRLEAISLEAITIRRKFSKDRS